MNKIDPVAVVPHQIENISEINVLKDSAAFQLQNVYVYTSRILPFKTRFPAVPSLLVGMTVAGKLRGKCSMGNSPIPLDLAPGHIFFIPPNTPFGLQVESRCEIVCIYVSENLFKSIETEFLTASESLLSLGHRFSVFDRFLCQVVLSIKENVERGGTFAGIELEYFARVLTARLIAKYSDKCPAERSGESGLSSTVLRQTLAYIDQNLDRRITVNTLSKDAGLGTAQFARLFKKSTNITFHQYIILRRIERARVLLEETRLSVAEIAQDCGFADQVHLTRFFNRIVGTSPALFRRNSQLKQHRSASGT